MPSEVPGQEFDPGMPEQGANGLVQGLPDKVQADQIAREIAEQHVKARQRKAQRDLICEMYMVHLDGEGDAQWTTILNGERLRIPPNLDGSVRRSTNLLRPIVANYVSYQTSIPYRVNAEPASGKKNKDKAKIDTLYGNHVIRQQRLNELFADAMWMAVPWGFCPIHASYREDLSMEVYQSPYQQQTGRPGYVDCWVGDPATMVFDQAATRRSIYWASYERIVPLSVVQSAFPDVPWLDAVKGRKDLHSAARFQLTAKRWLQEPVHGTPVLSTSGGTQDNVALVCHEQAPDDQHPDGRLVIVALSGVADTDRGKMGRPVLLHDGPLPGRRFSFVRLYSDRRYDDPYGYPWMTPLDELQVCRNNLETILVNGGNRASKPQQGRQVGSVEDDSTGFEADGVVEFTNVPPQYIEYPTNWMSAIENRLQATEESMFRIGGWQAASRGESNAGDPAAKVQMLAQADDSVHGTMNRELVGTLREYLQLVHALTREYSGPYPIPVKIAGDDYGYLSQSYITADQLSEEPPDYQVVSGFGSTPEYVASNLERLAQMTGADGEPMLSTKAMKRQYPDQSIWPVETDILDVKQRRAQAINYLIRDLCAQFEQQPPPEIAQQPPEWQEQYAVQSILQQLDMQEPIGRDDDIAMNIDTLSELTQDVSESRLVRKVAEGRQNMNYEWQAAMSAQVQPMGDAAQTQPAMQPAQPAAAQAPAYQEAV